MLVGREKRVGELKNVKPLREVKVRFVEKPLRKVEKEKEKAQKSEILVEIAPVDLLFTNPTQVEMVSATKDGESKTKRKNTQVLAVEEKDVLPKASPDHLNEVNFLKLEVDREQVLLASTQMFLLIYFAGVSQGRSQLIIEPGRSVR